MEISKTEASDAGEIALVADKGKISTSTKINIKGDGGREKKRERERARERERERGRERARERERETNNEGKIEKERMNQAPKGIMRSAVPLPCYFDVLKSHKVAGQRPQQGTKFCRIGRNSVCLSVHPSVHPSICHPYKGSEGQLEESESQLDES